MADKRVPYHEQRDVRNTIKLREVLATLPEFAKNYFRAEDMKTSTNTRIRYAYCIRIFFEFLKQSNPLYRDYALTDFTLSDLEKVTPNDIVEYIEFLKAYTPPSADASDIDAYVTNGEKGIKQKLSSLRSFYAYFYKQGDLSNNPTVKVDMPKLHQKEIIRLEPDEVARLLDYVESAGGDMNSHQRAYYEKTRSRDFAIMTLLLGTGIRVSECVGLDIEDVDFHTNSIKVFRKGGNEAFVYFGDEVADALKAYIEDRKELIPKPGHEHALFYSSQRKRIGVKTVENMVKKYAQRTTTKHITPHKLRSTFGTNLYRESGDIYLVADVLGHKDVNTTRTHYAAMADSRRRQAARMVHLREDLEEALNDEHDSKTSDGNLKAEERKEKKESSNQDTGSDGKKKNPEAPE